MVKVNSSDNTIAIIKQINQPKDIELAKVLNEQLRRLVGHNEFEIKLSNLKAYEIVQSIGQDSAMELGMET